MRKLLYHLRGFEDMLKWLQQFLVLLFTGRLRE